MIQKIKQFIVAGTLVLAGAAVLVPQVNVAALDPGKAISKGVDGAGGKSTSSTDLNVRLKQVVNVLLFVLGAIAVIMIVVGGIRYTLSAGDQTAIKAAKDTILYAVVGLVVAMLAYAIVNWVIKAFN